MLAILNKKIKFFVYVKISLQSFTESKNPGENCIGKKHLTKTKKKTESSIRCGKQGKRKMRRRTKKERRRKERAFLLVISWGYRRLAWIADANTPIPVTRKVLPDGIIRWIYLLSRDPETTSRRSPCETSEERKEKERAWKKEEEREIKFPVRCIERIWNWHSDSVEE